MLAKLWWQSITGYFSIISWVANVNWPPQRVSRLTFWALALTQGFIYSLLRRDNARNVGFKALYGGRFTLSSQLTILKYQDILAVWSSIIPNCKTAGIIHEYIALMHIVQPSVSFTEPKKLIRGRIRFIKRLTTSWTQKPKLLRGHSSQ